MDWKALAWRQKRIVRTLQFLDYALNHIDRHLVSVRPLMDDHPELGSIATAPPYVPFRDYNTNLKEASAALHSEALVLSAVDGRLAGPAADNVLATLAGGRKMIIGSSDAPSLEVVMLANSVARAKATGAAALGGGLKKTRLAHVPEHLDDKLVTWHLWRKAANGRWMGHIDDRSRTLSGAPSDVEHGVLLECKESHLTKLESNEDVTEYEKIYPHSKLLMIAATRAIERYYATPKRWPTGLRELRSEPEWLLRLIHCITSDKTPGRLATVEHAAHALQEGDALHQASLPLNQRTK
jgi:hypothetical protein